MTTLHFRKSIGRSLLRHSFFLLSLTLVLVCFGFSPNALGATFAPTEEERVAATKQGFHGELKLAVLPRKIDREGRTYVQVDDMLFWVREGADPESAFTGPRWTNGIVYYVFDAAVSSTNRQNWRHAAANWSAVAPLAFIEGTGNGNYIYVQNGGGNNSYVGMIGGPQEMNIVSWTYEFIIAHEIGHALGATHEHSRSDRNSYVTINYSNIQPEYQDQFYIEASTNYGTYDFDSVTHYGKCAFSIDCPPGTFCECTNYTITVPPPNEEWQDRIGQRDHLSQLDGAGMAQRYPRPPPPNDQCSGAITLSNGVTRTDITVSATSTGDLVPTCQTNFGKGVWYTFTPASSGTVTVSTCGSDFDTVLQIYTGTCAPQSQYACNDDDGPDCSGRQASVNFNGTAGTTYQILAGGYASSSGNLQIVARLGATPPPPAQLGNISTRAFVQTGDNVMIGGFIVQGTQPKRVIIRAIGPELSQYGVPNPMADPTLELHDGTGALIGSNDNWQHTIIGGIITHDQVQDIQNSGYAPGDQRESAIIADLPAGNYTAIARGVNSTTGVALVEVYNLSGGSDSILHNISTRSFVQTGDNVMIGGFIVQGPLPRHVIIRAIGPELSQYGIPNPMADPTLELHDGTGALIAYNDDWQYTIIGGIITQDQVQEIINSGLAPADPFESAIIATLPAGNYTAIVRGWNNTTGVALVEVYDLQSASARLWSSLSTVVTTIAKPFITGSK